MNLNKEQIEKVIDWMNTWEQLKNTAIPLRFKEEFMKQLILPVVSCSYIILYHNQEWDEFEGTLEQAIEHLKADSRYKDYGRNGATIFKGKDIYSIADKQTETIHI
tara:strand:+ start:115 stop:432 length:318 start_codon:yes stop_codon:yes gene_type:complete